MTKNLCPTARDGGTCTDPSCSKRHEFVRCEPCDCYLPTFSLEEHMSGKRHLRNAASKDASNQNILHRVQQVPPSQSASSKLPSTPPVNTSPLPGGKQPNPDGDPSITRHGEGSSRTDKVPYCATTLRGDTCVDSRCQYRHDTVRCKPCGLSLPASLLDKHRTGKLHLRNVALDGSTDPSTPQQPRPSLPATPTPVLPLRSISPLSRGSSITPAVDLPVTVSHEGGLDFVAQGTGTVADHSFPSINHTISIGNTSLSSNLSVQSMKLAPSPSLSPWCEWFDICIQLLIFSSQLFCITTWKDGDGSARDAAYDPRGV
jgi:hypothetical protein